MVENENQQIVKSFEQTMMNHIQQVESKMKDFSEHQKNIFHAISTAIQGFISTNSKVKLKHFS